MFENFSGWTISIRAANSGRFTDYARSSFAVLINEDMTMKKTYIDFKTYCDNFLDRIREGGSAKNTLCGDAMVEYGITSAVFCKRFKSYYGMTCQEKIVEIITPTKEQMTKAIMVATSTEDLWKTLNLSLRYRKGLFDKYYGVSTLERARAKICLDTFETKYNPTIDENKSLVCSQVLGDGCFRKTRGAIEIVHGLKQLGYLTYKASLFNKAFPTTNPAGSTKVFDHKQGHRYCKWFSGRLPEKITQWVLQATQKEIVESLTPRGILLWFLDDGYLNMDTTVKGNTYVEIYVHNDEAFNALISVLESYGIKSTTSRNYLKIGTIEGCVMFYKCFIEPFLDEIPECMLYKTKLKI